MRTSFINELIRQARLHSDIFLVVGDLGYSVVEPFAAEFPERFLNAGVAEQNMTGVAAGLASEGYHVFTYSIGNFPTLRCLEQVRNDVCYHQLPVTVVAVGGGLAYGNLGYSHHAVQDLGVMRSLPGITVVAPADPGETAEAVQWLAAHPRPSYLRLGKAGEPALHSVKGLSSGPLAIREESGPCAIVSTGGMLKTALEVHELLKGGLQSVSVYSLPWIKPLTAEFLRPLCRFSHIVALEEHVAEGGLASALRENLPLSIQVRSLCLREDITHRVGSQQYLRDLSGLSPSAVACACREIIATC